MQFVQTVTDLASKSHNVEFLERAGVLETVCPLINDIVPTIRQTAVITLGRLASHDIKIAQAILRKDVVPCIIKNVEKQNVRKYKTRIIPQLFLFTSRTLSFQI